MNNQPYNSSTGFGGLGLYEPTIRFTTPGTYNVRQVVNKRVQLAAGEQNCFAETGDKLKYGYITVPYLTPVSAFNSNGSAANKTINAGTAVSFTDASTNFPTNWTWSITPTTGWSFTSGGFNSQNPTVLFSKVGAYTISLVASNPSGSSNITKTNHLNVVPVRPVVNFNANGNGGASVGVLLNNTTSFNDVSTNDPTAWTWTITPAGTRSFVSGTSAASRNPQVDFSAIGTYSVSLTASNGGGAASASKTNYIVVFPRPPVVANEVISYCQGTVSTQLQATGTALKWYTTADGGTAISTAPTPSTATAGITYYYVSQTVSGYESPRQNIIIVVNPLPQKPVIAQTVITHCTGSVASALTASGSNLKWYNTLTGGTGSAVAPVPNTSVAGSLNYYVTQTDSKGCESPRALITVNVINQLPLPVVTAPVNYCLDGPAIPLVASATVGSGLQWFTVSTGGAGTIDAPIPSTATSGIVNYYVAQTLTGCATGPRAIIPVNTSTIPTPDGPVFTTPIVYTQGQDAVPLSATGTLLKWYASGVGGTALPFAPLPLTGLTGTESFFVTQTVNGCESRRDQLDVVTNPGVPVPAPAWASAFGFYSSTTDAYNTHTIVNLGTVSNSETVLAGELSQATTFGKNVANQNVTLAFTPGSANGYLVRYDVAGVVLWAVKTGVGSPGSVIVPTAIVKANYGGTYISGKFVGAITFGSTNLTSDNGTDWDIFVALYNAAGQVMWAKKAGSADGSDNVYAMASDNIGNFYISGVTGGISANFGTVTLAKPYAPYLAKYNSMGTAVWVKAGPSGTYPGQSMSIDQVSNAASGSYNVLLTDGYSLLKYTSNGDFVRTVTSIRYGATSTPAFQRVASDANGNSFVAGSFEGTVRFDSLTSLTVVRNYGEPLKRAVFLAKYDSAGKFLWVRKGGGGGGNDAAFDIATDDYGNAYSTGYFSGTALFGSQSLVSAGGTDGYLVKYGPQGNEVWARKISGAASEIGRSISIDDVGNLYVAGTGSAVTFDGLAIPAISGRFVAKIGTTIPAPGIFTISPPAAFSGTKVSIIGKGLINTTYIDFNGQFAEKYTVISSSQIDVLVPFGATTGPVSLSTPIGSYTDTTDFVVKPNAFDDDSLPPAKWRWAKLVRDQLSGGEKTAMDKKGNIVVLGTYSHVVNLLDTVLTATDIQNNSSIYLAKYDAGGHFKWAVTSGGNATVTSIDIATDEVGNIFVSGHIQLGNTVFTIGNETLQQGGMFLAKFNPQGLLSWIRKTDGIERSGYGFQMEVDKGGNVLIRGTFSETVNFGGMQLSSPGVTTAYLVKYDASGVVQWTKQTPAASALLTTDDEQNILYAVSGMLNKLTPDGETIWSKERITGLMKADKDNNLYVTGSFNYDVDLDFGIVVLRGTAYTSGYLAKYNKDGEILWARIAYDAEYSPDNSPPSALKVDSAGYLYLQGSNQAGMKIGKKILSNYGTIWLAKFDPTGAVSWATDIPSFYYNSVSYPTGLHVKATDELVVTGSIFGDYKFGDTSLSVRNALNDPFFVAPFIAKMGGPAPAINNFYTTQGAVGDTVSIDGVNFIGTTQVRFNGTESNVFSVLSARKILALVPPNAATGTIVVTTPNGTAKASADFLISGNERGLVELCPGSSVLLSSSIAGTNYQWQVDNGAGFENISDVDKYDQFNAAVIKVKDANSNMYGFKYRCMVDGSFSDTITLRFVSYWSGSINDDWDNIGNWGCGKSIPDANTDVYIPAGSATIRSNVFVRSLTISPATVLNIEEGYSLKILK